MKKSNLFKKVAALGMALMLVIGATATAAVPGADASVNNIAPSDSVQNIAIVQMSNNLQKGSLCKLTCYGSTAVQLGYHSAVTVELQEYNGGWHTIKTWSATGNSFAGISETYYGNSNYSYRLRLTHTAYDSNWNYVESYVKFSRTV
ncbi:MAG: hypothetical protein J1F01_00025 [Oscillospiraceae bacterium]|nr:hypothetical protein [Oscillospiraceae bacterium]